MQKVAAVNITRSGAPSKAADLSRRAAAGDDRAFEKLMRVHWDGVYRMAAHRVGNEADAQDIAQEAFATAHKSMSSLKDHGLFKPWLYRVALNKVTDHLRKKKIMSLFTVFTGGSGGLDQAQAETAENSGPAGSQNREFWTGIRNFVDSLPKGEQEAFRLKYLDELTVSETALVLKVSPSTVKTRLVRAVRKFKENSELLETLGVSKWRDLNI